MKRKLMKKLLLVVVMVVLCLAVGMTASAETWGDYEYTVLEDGTVEITKYTGSGGEIEIPSEIDGKTVTGIGEFAFGSCDGLINIYIPKTIKTVGKAAFSSLLLQKIEVDTDNLAYCNDEYGVLFDKKKNELIRYPSGNKTAIYKIPDSVQTIETQAFYFCIFLDQVIFSDNLLRINDYAFYGSAFAFDEIYLPKSVEYVGYQAFGQIPYYEKLYVESKSGFFGFPIFAMEYSYSGKEKSEIVNIVRTYYEDSDINSDILEDYLECVVTPDDDGLCGKQGTIYCHADSTAEAYAIENGIDYELMHFYEDEWTYDYDNCAKYRKCIHCDEIETEELIPETPAEPDVPMDEDAKEPLYVQLFDLIKMFFALIISLFKK